ncbi:ATP-dependent helicase [Roseospira visakhapatnamensis]|uniref:DNA 3'-5' helicase n=1 Tax=Roseospira visakhapatnamensis TaxID=390880 RepID=A0A7W6RD99_9PROT|nr:UvrD-helicase domain-containing protein [Roseospira visakhapatnamensis]MBB4266332.1 DNA helicase-2/ATP-dependent DNA helicase PcrA [Roseospira visakhapatnamensis]
MTDPFDLTDAPLPPAPADPAAPDSPPWLDGLNPEQRRAVEATEGPVLVLSGAGTGKTRVLTTRVAHILHQGLAQPWRVLAVTFTNRAAREMRARLGDMIGPTSESVWLGTFHALSLRILRRHVGLVGLRDGFTILDADDQLRLLKQIMEGQGLDPRKDPPKVAMALIQRWKDRGLTPDRVPAEDARGIAGRRALDLYGRYQARLLELNACDFGDLLLHCLRVLQDNPEIAADYQRRFRYILVDEYQDTNVAQYLWLRLLAAGHKNLCCVGDDDQSIYSWRGAEVGNILRFESDYPGATVVRLESNYRSTAPILGAASGLIRHNGGRLGKDLRATGAAADDPDAAPVRVRGLWDGEAEARWLAEEVESLTREGHGLGSMAILVRAAFQMREFEDRLMTCGIPFRVVGGPRFYERLEIRDALAYLRLIAQPDDDLAFERIVNKPKRGLGEASLQALQALARAQGVPLLAAARDLGTTDDLKPRARKILAGFVEDIGRWRDLRDGLPPSELCATVLEDSGYVAMWKADKSPDAPGRVENLEELVGAIAEFDSLDAFLEHIALVMENEGKAEQDGITLMTLHAAKGLEFDVVFLPGWEEDLFPHRRALEESGDAALEEERRLAYVGLTRARKRAFVSFAANRRIYNQWQASLPSRFIDELPEAFTEKASDTGLYGAVTAGFAEHHGGWATRHPRRAAVSPGTGSWKARDREGEGDDIAIGQRVFHQKFGRGQVLANDGGKLSVNFETGGLKKVVAGFVEVV